MNSSEIIEPHHYPEEPHEISQSSLEDQEEINDEVEIPATEADLPIEEGSEQDSAQESEKEDASSSEEENKEKEKPTQSSDSAQTQSELPTSLKPSLGIGIDLSFELGKEHISLEDLRQLQEGKVFLLGGDDFHISVKAQEKIIASAKLIMLDGRPAVELDRMVSPPA